MYPHTEGVTDDRRQVDVDEHPHEDLQEAQRHEQHGDEPAGQHEYGTGEAGYTGPASGEPASDQDRTREYGEPAADQDRSREYGEPAADQEEYAEPAGERDRVAERAGQHDQLNGSTGYAEPELARRPGDDSREEPAAVSAGEAGSAGDEALADRPAAQAPADAASTGAYTAEQRPTERAPQPTDGWQLFGAEDADNLRSQWAEVQGSFVDDPKHAVEQAEQFVSDVVQAVMDRFNERRKDLQAHGPADTEEMRMAMVRYRVFFRQVLGG